jgi:hypothetical protein
MVEIIKRLGVAVIFTTVCLFTTFSYAESSCRSKEIIFREMIVDYKMFPSARWLDRRGFYLILFTGAGGSFSIFADFGDGKFCHISHGDHMFFLLRRGS